MDVKEDLINEMRTLLDKLDGLIELEDKTYIKIEEGLDEAKAQIWSEQWKN